MSAKAKQEGGQHYKEMGIEPWDVVDTWSLEQQIGAYRHGVIKYTMRLGAKDKRLLEAKKALHYAEKLVEALEKEECPSKTTTPTNTSNDISQGPDVSTAGYSPIRTGQWMSVRQENVKPVLLK